jgi:hypothetical protein
VARLPGKHRFDFNGKEQIATLGSHPAVSIAEARRRREHNRAMIDDGACSRSARPRAPHKSKELAGRVFMFAIAVGDKRVDRNPAADLKLALKACPDVHLAAVTKPADVGKLMRAIEEAKGFQPATLAALKLLPHVFLQPGEPGISASL